MLSYSFHLYFRVIFASFLQMLAGGLVLGFAPLKPMLIDSHIFEELCQIGEELPCNAQTLALNRISIFATAGVNVIAFLIGMLNDWLQSSRKVFSIGGVCVPLSLILFSIFLNAEIDVTTREVFLCLMFALVGCFGNFLFLGLLYFIQTPPNRSAREAGYSNAVLNGAWDLSSGVFYILSLFFYNFDIPLHTLFLGYGLFLYVPILFFLYIFYIPSHIAEDIHLSLLSIKNNKKENKKTQQLIDDSTFNSEIEVITEEEMEHNGNSSLKEKEEKEEKETEQEPVEFILMLRNPKLYIFWMAVAIFVLQGVWYISTALEQLRWTSKNNESALMLNSALSIAMPAVGLIGGPINGYITGGATWQPWIVLSCLQIIWGTLSIIRVESIQWIVVILFAFWRMLGWCAILCYVGLYFPSTMFGRVLQGATELGGALSFVPLGLNPLVLNQLEGNYLPVNATIIGLNIILFIAVAYLARKEDKKRGNMT